MVWQKLYKLGGRKVGVTTLPPLGCLPATITLFGSDTNECVKRLNIDAIHFNRKLNASAIALQKKLSGLNIVVFDIYTPLFDLIKKPQDSGTLSLSLGIHCLKTAYRGCKRVISKGGTVVDRELDPSLLIWIRFDT